MDQDTLHSAKTAISIPSSCNSQIFCIRAVAWLGILSQVRAAAPDSRNA